MKGKILFVPNVQVKGIEESDVTPGFVLCSPTNPIKTGRVFDAQVRHPQDGCLNHRGPDHHDTFQIVMLDLKSIICAGYSCMLHLQAMAEEVGMDF